MSNYNESIIILNNLQNFIKEEKKYSYFIKKAIFNPTKTEKQPKKQTPLHKFKNETLIKNDLAEAEAEKRILEQQLSTLINPINNKDIYVKKIENAKQNIKYYDELLYSHLETNEEAVKNLPIINSEIEKLSEEIKPPLLEIKQINRKIEKSPTDPGNTLLQEEIQVLNKKLAPLNEKLQLLKSQKVQIEEVINKHNRLTNYLNLYQQELKTNEDNLLNAEFVDEEKINELKEKLEQTKIGIAELQRELETFNVADVTDLSDYSLEGAINRGRNISEIPDEEIEEQFVSPKLFNKLQKTEVELASVNEELFKALLDDSNKLIVKDKYKEVYSLIKLCQIYEEKIRKNENVEKNDVLLQKTYNEMMNKLTSFPELNDLVRTKNKLEKQKSVLRSTVNSELNFKNSLISTIDTERPRTREEGEQKLKQYYTNNKTYYIEEIVNTIYEHLQYSGIFTLPHLYSEFLYIKDDETINLEHVLLTPSELEKFKNQILVDKEKLENYIKLTYFSNIPFLDMMVSKIETKIDKVLLANKNPDILSLLQKTKKIFMEIFFGITHERGYKKQLFSPITTIIKKLTQKIQTLITKRVNTKNLALQNLEYALNKEKNKLSEMQFHYMSEKIEDTYEEEKSKIENDPTLSPQKMESLLYALEEYKNEKLNGLEKRDNDYIENLKIFIQKAYKQKTFDEFDSPKSQTETNDLKLPTTSDLIQIARNFEQGNNYDKIQSVVKNIFNYMVYNNENLWMETRNVELNPTVTSKKLFTNTIYTLILNKSESQKNIISGEFSMFFCNNIKLDQEKEDSKPQIISYGKLIIDIEKDLSGKIITKIKENEPSIVNGKFNLNTLREEKIAYSIVENVIRLFMKNPPINNKPQQSQTTISMDKKEFMQSYKNQIIEKSIKNYKEQYPQLNDKVAKSQIEKVFENLLPTNMKQARLNKITALIKLAELYSKENHV